MTKSMGKDDISTLKTSYQNRYQESIEYNMGFDDTLFIGYSAGYCLPCGVENIAIGLQTERTEE